MVEALPNRLLGVGLYSVPEAARLARVPQGTIRRWLFGYSYRYRTEERHAPPVWTPQIQDRVDGHPIVSFADLIEIQLVHSFRKFGLTWNSIRTAAQAAREMYETGHPFASGRFQTDGRTVLLHVAEATRSSKLLDMCKNQFVFKDIVRDGLRGSIEWMDRAERGLPARWWPLGRRTKVVVDPNRRFGTPIVSDSGVSTALLAGAYQTMHSADEVSDWYGVSPREVRTAVEFERQLAA
jgi:uncharacterized protein (DUF433 family)